jgi:hypothetical protein
MIEGKNGSNGEDTNTMLGDYYFKSAPEILQDLIGTKPEPLV